MILRFQRLFPDASPIKRAHSFDCAFDVESYEDAVLPPLTPVRIHTGLVISIHREWAALILPRSGLASKHNVTVANAPGLIDPGYRGELMVSLINHSRLDYVVEKGDRVAQILLVQHGASDVLEVADASELHTKPDERGTGGFGSTGR